MNHEEKLLKDMIAVSTIKSYIESYCSIEDGRYLNMSSICNILLASLYSIVIETSIDPSRREEFDKVVKSYIGNLNIDILNVIEEYRRKPTDPSLN